MDAGYFFLHTYADLAYECLLARRPNFKTRLKFHSFHHILHTLDIGDTLNPRVTGCWLEEVHVGRICKSGKGTHPFTCGGRTLQRWLAGLLADLIRKHP